MNRLITPFRNEDANIRLQAALAAGTDPIVEDVPVLIDQCRTDPDFFVRDMLTWALTRHPGNITVPLLFEELHASVAQARAEALHTLSKLATKDGGRWTAAIWEELTDDLLSDHDDEVARAAWRTAAGVVPESERTTLATRLSIHLGRGDREVRRSLSRAFLDLGEQARPALEAVTVAPQARLHARSTLLLLNDPGLGFDVAECTAAGEGTS